MTRDRTRDGTEEALPEDLLLLAAEERQDDRLLRRTLVVAIALHLLAALIQLPGLPHHVQAEPEARDQLYVLHSPVFEAPEIEERKIPEKKPRRTPIPDPTPDDPEPIVVPEEEAPVLELPDEPSLFRIPEAPPPVEPEGPLRIRAGIEPPTRLHAPPPSYTEPARKAGIEGIVELEAVIDREGRVTDVRVLRALPFGLTEAAVEAVEGWRYRPALRRGEPVSVYLTVTVRFAIAS